MNKILLYVFIAFFSIISSLLLLLDYKLYAFFSMLLGVTAYLYISNHIISSEDNLAKYKRRLKSILKTYDAVLVQSIKEISIKDHNPIILPNIEDLIDAQTEIRKPIIYHEEMESCYFTLLDDNEVYIYILRKEENTISSIDNEIELVKEQNNKQKNSSYDDMFENIDKTTILRLGDTKLFKISPIKKNNIGRTMFDLPRLKIK